MALDSPARVYGLTCGICNEKETPRIAAKKLLGCDGYCGRYFHPQCLSLPADIIDICSKYEKFIEFKCTDCRRTTTAHAIKCINEAVIDLKREMCDQNRFVHCSIVDSLTDLIRCNDCAYKTYSNASIQCDSTDSDAVEIPIPETFELDNSGEWKIVGNKKVWKKWSPSDTEKKGNDSSKSKTKRKRRIRKRNDNAGNFNDNFMNGSQFNGMGAWNQGPPAAVFQESNFENRNPTRRVLNQNRKSIKISGLSPNVTEQELSEYICNTFNIREFVVRLLTPRNLRFPASYLSFKVTVPEGCVNLIRNPRHWDLGTKISEFKEGLNRPLGFRDLRSNNQY